MSARSSATLFACLLALGPSSVPAEERSLFVRGLVDLSVSDEGPGLQYNWFNRGDSNFDPYRLRLFAEGSAAPGFQYFTQFLFEEMADVRALGAYVMYTPLPNRDFHVQAGKIPWLVGSYAARTYSDRNPLIGTPLMYQYHTSLRADRLAPSTDALLAAAGTGQTGPIYDAGGRGFRGMPIIYDLCWDFGVMVNGSERPIEYAFGFVNGTPSSPNAGPDRNGRPAWLGRLGAEPWPGVRGGISAAYGPYFSSAFDPLLPEGSNAEAYAQRLVTVDLEWMFAHVEMRGEAFHNTWQTPYAGELQVRGGYLEGRVGLPAGLFAAARIETMRFGDVADSTGTVRPWDHDVGRFETALGYRVQRGVTIKAAYQRNVMNVLADRRTADIYGAQLSLRF